LLTPHKKDPTVKITMPRMYKRLRPYMSATRPMDGTNTVTVNVYMIRVQATCSILVFKSMVITGKATNIIVPLKDISNVPNVVQDKTVHL